ncbi:IS5 family transposase [Pseudomonas sp. BP8]|nr:IS5 family transposase [Pseudomonas sp. BP8]
MQNWFSLSDPAMEEALYEITSMRQFARLTLSAPIPEDTTIMIPAPPAETQVGGRHPGNHQPLPARQRPVVTAGHDCRSNNHPSAQFGYVKTRFCGWAKNTAQLITLFALSNLWMARRQLLSAAGEVRR